MKARLNAASDPYPRRCGSSATFTSPVESQVVASCILQRVRQAAGDSPTICENRRAKAEQDRCTAFASDATVQSRSGFRWMWRMARPISRSRSAAIHPVFAFSDSSQVRMAWTTRRSASRVTTASPPAWSDRASWQMSWIVLRIQRLRTPPECSRWMAGGQEGDQVAGRRVLSALHHRGLNVRGVSRSTELPFDWADESTWSAALDGIDRAYVTYAPDIAVPGAVERVGALVELAVAKGIRRIVLLTGRGEEEAQRGERRGWRPRGCPTRWPGSSTISSRRFWTGGIPR